MGWLAQENATTANIDGVANPLCPSSRKRTEDGIGAGQVLYSDLVRDGDSSFASIPVWDVRNPPNVFVSTLRVKCQVLGRMDGFTCENQERALKLLADTFGGDAPLTDYYSVLRLPEFLNCNYDPAYRVTIECQGALTSNPGDLWVTITKTNLTLSSRAFPPRKHPDNHINSEHNWASVLRQLTHEKNVARLTRCLASRCSDMGGKVECLTSLWLIQGLPMDDAVNNAETSPFEIPSHFDSLVRELLRCAIHAFCAEVEAMVVDSIFVVVQKRCYAPEEGRDTSPPSWELRSSRERDEVYAGKRLASQRLCSAITSHVDGWLRLQMDKRSLAPKL